MRVVDASVLTTEFPIPSLTHYILSMLTCNLNLALTQASCQAQGWSPHGQQSFSVNPLSTIRTLAHWIITGASDLTSPTKLWHTSSLYASVLRLVSSKLSQLEGDRGTTLNVVAPFPAPELLCLSSGVSKNREILLILYVVDHKGIISLIASARISVSYPVQSRRNLRFAQSTTPFFLQPSWRTFTLRGFYLFSGLEPQSTFANSKTFRPHLLGYFSFRRLRTVFGFLRYAGPRRLSSPRKVILDEGDYQITHIGRGAFAVISRVFHRPSRMMRVMKRITFDMGGLAEYLVKNEVDTLKAMTQVGSPWFPPLLNHFTEGEEYVVTMPYYQRGDLAGFMEHKAYLGRQVAQFYCSQLILAIHSLHKMGIIHRDIKPDNIFLDEQGNLILADLGLAENIATFEGGEAMMVDFPVWVEARDKGGDDFPLLWVNHLNPLATSGAAGTFWYTAPEVFRKEQYSFGVDYWSVGVIYHELITGHIPFNHFKPYPEDKKPALDFRIKPGQLKDIELWEKEALAELLRPSPSERPKTLSDIKGNRIFNGVDWDKVSRREIIPPALPSPLQED